jgi:SAM-dependent methyltransferase
MKNDLQSTTRFSSRVDDYAKYRPDYPRGVLEVLHERVGLAPDWIVADVGCGTGISCRMFLENGNEVFGVEPNDDMRRVAEREFASHAKFHPIKAAAEETTLAGASVDLVVAAQAYHWFDRAATAREFKRILRERGFIAIMWNTRLTSGPFAREYDELLHRHGTDYKEVAHRTPMSPDDFTKVFGTPFQRIATPNEQVFDLNELLGRVRSSSYTPLPGQPGHDELFDGVRRLFEKCQQDGHVKFEYETEMFVGTIG